MSDLLKKVLIKYGYILERNVPNKNKTRTINLNRSKVHTHMLRHTYATRCIEAGMKPVVLQKLLGHSSIDITLRNLYISIWPISRNRILQS